jgi:4-hydroxy-tetrahydrodipicolinate synthase
MTGAGLNRRHALGIFAGAAAGSALPRAARAAAGARALRGVFPIAFTPVKGGNQVDYEGLASQVKFLQRGGVQGVAWPQIASGWTVLSEKERMEGAEALTGAAKGGSTAVVIGVQSPDFAAVTRYAKQAEKLGADAIICIPPAGVSDEKVLLDYYQKVGKLTHLPLFLQAVGSMSIDLVVKMVETIPTLRHVKDEAGQPLQRIGELRRRTGDKLKVFSGNGVKTFITELERGTTGCCPYVSLADVYARAFDDWQAGRKQAAFNSFSAIMGASAMFAQGNVNVLIARGVFKPGTRTRAAPPVPGAVAAGTYIPETTPEQIKRVLDTYMKPYLRA